MKKALEVGITHSEKKQVTPEDTAEFYQSGRLKVLATPAMIALMEMAAMKTILPYLEDEEDTVGFELSIKHFKPTPVGDAIECEAILTETNGKKLVFEVVARDAKEVIGKGRHVRYVIHPNEFMSNIKT